MIQGTNSLLYQCFQAKYFPQSSFLDAIGSPNCSFVWRNLMAALPILKFGHCWRVGNGSSIRVQRDRRIPNHPTNKIFHLVNEEINDWVVSNFINPELHVWRSDAVMSIFQREDAEAVCRIPLSWRNVPDSIIWLHNKKGTLLSNRLIR